MEPPRLQFGFVPPPSFLGVEAHVDELLRWVGERAGVVLSRRQVASYGDLARLLRGAILQVAWLPPIPFARLDLEGVVRELACAERGEGDAFVAVLVARADAAIGSVDDLRGRSVAWVDPLSATGYVVPRMRMAASGRTVEGFFGKETFLGSHAAVVGAVLDGTADAGATYAGLAAGELSRGAWDDLGASSSKLAIVEAFGAVPSDVIAAHAQLAEPTTLALAEAFEATREVPRLVDAVRLVFGAAALVRRPLVGYDLLRSQVAHGVDSAVVPAAAAFLSSRPPTR
jgi:ABC-type phosphate/phosphonate transport system substrate-binding protein